MRLVRLRGMVAGSMTALVLASLALSGCAGNEPELPVQAWALAGLAADPRPHELTGCDQLLDTLTERAALGARLNMDSVGETAVAQRSGGIASLSEAGSSVAHGVSDDIRFTGTNTQIPGVDEGDMVKVDAPWTYIFADGVLHVIVSDSTVSVEEIGRLEIGDGEGTLLLQIGAVGQQDDRLLVVQAYAKKPGDDSRRSWTRATVIDIADRTSPRIEAETWLPGSPSATRLADGVAYLVTTDRAPGLGLSTDVRPTDLELRQHGLTRESYRNAPEPMQDVVRAGAVARVNQANHERLAGLELGDHVAPVEEVVAGVATEVGSVCTDVLAVPDMLGRDVTVILALDLKDASLASTVTRVLGNARAVHATADQIALAGPVRPAIPSDDVALRDASLLHLLDLDGVNVTHRASGIVPGTVQDQFSMDARNGRLRVAASLGVRAWDETAMVSHVTVLEPLEGLLVPVATLAGIAPGERIWSARFEEERLYLVTFPDVTRMRDPFWVIDLSANIPTVLGELEVPGVTTYLHPISKDAVATIGYGPEKDDTGLDWGRIQVALYDVSDPRLPRRADVVDLVVDKAGGRSAAVDDHHAFTYWSEEGLLAVPLEVWDPVTMSHVATLQLLEVDEEGMDLRWTGFVNQALLQGTMGASGLPIERSLFSQSGGERSVHTVSRAGVAVHDLERLEVQDIVPFGPSPPS